MTGNLHTSLNHSPFERAAKHFISGLLIFGLLIGVPSALWLETLWALVLQALIGGCIFALDSYRQGLSLLETLIVIGITLNQAELSADLIRRQKISREMSAAKRERLKARLNWKYILAGYLIQALGLLGATAGLLYIVSRGLSWLTNHPEIRSIGEPAAAFFDLVSSGQLLRDHALLASFLGVQPGAYMVFSAGEHLRKGEPVL